MSWFLWGITFGWAVCSTYHYFQTDNEKVSNGAVIIFLALGIVAVIISINLGMESGTITREGLNITPTPIEPAR